MTHVNSSKDQEFLVLMSNFFARPCSLTKASLALARRFKEGNYVGDEQVTFPLVFACRNKALARLKLRRVSWVGFGRGSDKAGERPASAFAAFLNWRALVSLVCILFRALALRPVFRDHLRHTRDSHQTFESPLSATPRPRATPRSFSLVSLTCDTSQSVSCITTCVMGDNDHGI